MDVYIVMYDACDGGSSICCGVYASKILAEKKILERIASWGNGHAFIRKRDRWVLDRHQNEYRIEQYKLEEDFEIKEPEHN